MLNISQRSSNEFTTGKGAFTIGEYIYDPHSASLSKSDQVELIDADDFLNDLASTHNLETQLPAARQWLASELYDDSLPTLAALRLKMGLTQSQLAAIVKQPQSSISRLESGGESPSIDRAAELAQALGVSLDVFYSALTAARSHRKT